MKTSLNLQDLAAQVQMFEEKKKDFLSPAKHIQMLNFGDDVVLPVQGQDFAITANAHSQISAHLGIPKRYYDKMLVESPELLCRNANHWWKQDEGTRMIRTLDNRCRALLSSKYRPLDNYDLLKNALPHISEAGLEIASCDVDENRLFLKCLSPKLKGEYKKGDVLQFGFLIKNNEVGKGRIEISQFIYRLVCENGMIGTEALRRNHVGGRGSSDEMKEYYRDETKVLQDKAFWAKFTDTLDYFLSPSVVEDSLKVLREGGKRGISSTKLDAVVEVTGKLLGTTEKENDDILSHLARGGDLTAWGLANAVTRTAEDADDYDRATEMEVAGHRIITLSDKDWKAISEAA